LQLECAEHEMTKWMAEPADLHGYVNSWPSVPRILAAHGHAIAISQFGTHFLENNFTVRRVQCSGKDTYPQFLTSLWRTVILDSILQVTNWQLPAKRRSNIARCRLSRFTELIKFMRGPADTNLVDLLRKLHECGGSNPTLYFPNKPCDRASLSRLIPC
jgi:hypothetical protein